MTKRRRRPPHAWQVPHELPITGLYWAAMDACHAVGIAWTDPRTGVSYPPPPPLSDAVVDAFLETAPSGDPHRTKRIRRLFNAKMKKRR